MPSIRQYTAEAREAFRGGLRRETDSPLNASVLATAFNCRATDVGLRAPVIPVNLFSAAYSVSWPFPQLIRGMNVTLLCYDTAIYLVDETTSPWGLNQITTYDADDLATTKSIVSGGYQWELIDFGPSWILLNEKNTIYKAPSTVSGYTSAAKYALRTDRPLITGCQYQGRAWIAGFDWLSGWNDSISTWLDGLPMSMDSTLEFTDGTVLHSSVGASELWGLLGSPEFAHQGWVPEDTSGQDTWRSHFMEQVVSGAVGWKPVLWQGSVLRLLPLGDGVIAYGEGGISLLLADGSETVLLRKGVHSRGAAGGDEKQHVFVDASGVLWRINVGGDINRLGYEEFLSQLDSPVAITYNPDEKEYIISDGALSYVLTKNGLTQITHAVTSGCCASNAFVGVYADPADDDANRFEVCTDGWDFESSGFFKGEFKPNELKTITEVKVGIKSKRTGGFSTGFSAGFDRIGGYGYVAIDYRNTTNGDWTRSSWKKLNAKGWARVQISGTEFRCAVKFPDYEDIYCDYVQIQYVKR